MSTFFEMEPQRKSKSSHVQMVSRQEHERLCEKVKVLERELEAARKNRVSPNLPSDL